ncbi:MAG: hypothetical protein LC734_00010 [Acidobacteria bacterium]|nr:hypothetical protein [Acidobacteriota bacterium]
MTDKPFESLPNSRLRFGNIFTSGGAIVLAPGTGGPFANTAVFRPQGTAPFVQFPFTGGSAGTFGLNFPFTSGPPFGFPTGTGALIGPPRQGGEGADLFPGIGSVFGSILPGIVLQAAGGPVPTVFTVAPSYLNDAPFVNRTFGESSFNTFTGGIKWRFTGINNPVGVGIVAYYKYFADRADDFSGFNQLQRGASAGGSKGDIGVTLFGDARLRRWVNLSANVGYVYTTNPKIDDFTLLDRGDELQAAFGVDFPVNKYFQPIVEFRSLQYVGGRTPNAFENNPMDGIAGARFFPARWFGFGVAYRRHFNDQDADSFDDEETFTTSVNVPPFQGSPGRTVVTSFSGVPPGFRTSEDPHGFIIQGFIGRRNPRAVEVVNQFANVTNLVVSDTTITLPCPPGFRPADGQVCADNTTVTVATTAVDPENDILTYNYTVSGGRIVGTGANVEWDVSGLAPGTYTITSGVDDGCGLCGQTQTRTITIAECVCVRVCECPSVSVTGPAGITRPSDTMTFTANVSGGSQQGPITYNWRVDRGTIESGQGTPSITVRTNQADAGSNVTATVDIGGLDPGCDCPREANATGPVEGAPEASSLGEIGPVSNDEVRAQLDTFFAELQNNPNDQGYVITYGTPRQIAQRERLITNHIAFRQFDRSRITLVQGTDTGDGPRSRLFRIPPGATPPTP